MMMPQIEETLAGSLTWELIIIKESNSPTKLCRVTSSLVGKAFQAAGQAGAALHTMAVLQAYQADLLKDLSTGGSIDEEAFLELCRATDLSLRATKQTARAIGRSMAAMVSTERHLWLNLTGIKDKDHTFLLDAPISPSGLFGDAVNTVATRFREAKRYEEAFVRFLPHRAQESGPSATRSQPGPVPLRREAQKESVASRAPPRRDWGAARRASQSAAKRPDLRSIISSKKKPWGLRAQDRGGVPPPGGEQKVPTENKDSFLAPSGCRCTISATGVSGSSSLQRNVTCSVASCHVSGHRTSNIPPVKILPFGLALSPRTYTKCMDAALAPLRLQGIRILNYIDDRLILAQSQELALRHRDVVLAHLESLGLRLNAKKSVLSPAQRTMYLGVVWDSITMQAQLSPARVESILNALKNIKLGQRVTVHYLQRVLGLMAAASTVIPLGLLHMRSFQLWLRARGFHPRANPQRQIRVTRQGLRTLSMWFRHRIQLF